MLRYLFSIFIFSVFFSFHAHSEEDVKPIGYFEGSEAASIIENGKLIDEYSDSKYFLWKKKYYECIYNVRRKDALYPRCIEWPILNSCTEAHKLSLFTTLYVLKERRVSKFEDYEIIIFFEAADNYCEPVTLSKKCLSLSKDLIEDPIRMEQLTRGMKEVEVVLDACID